MRRRGCTRASPLSLTQVAAPEAIKYGKSGSGEYRSVGRARTSRGLLSSLSPGRAEVIASVRHRARRVPLALLGACGDHGRLRPQCLDY